MDLRHPRGPRRGVNWHLSSVYKKHDAAPFMPRWNSEGLDLALDVTRASADIAGSSVLIRSTNFLEDISANFPVWGGGDPDLSNNRIMTTHPLV